tara:strand:- start:40 stop:282 length:243 start_codon:yes stop_codon:yes gene_type:complete
MFNPAESIYREIDKRIKQGKIISEEKKQKPKGKGILARSKTAMENTNASDYSEPIDFVVDAVITLRKEKEKIMENTNADT